MTTQGELNAAKVNAMLGQKEEVCRLIMQKEFSQAKKMLDLFHPLWNLLGYGYKGRELYRLVRESIRQEIAAEEEFVLAEKKNSIAKKTTLRNIEMLKQLVAEC